MLNADSHARSRRLTAGIALSLALGAIVPARASTATPAASASELTAALSSTEITLGRSASVTGRLLADGQPRAGVPLSLQRDPYPYRGFAAAGRTVTAADGSFGFSGIAPDRNTRLRVVAEGAASAVSRVLELTVDPQLTGRARSLGPGRVLLSIRVRHTLGGGRRGSSVRWFLAAPGSRVFRLAASTGAREVGHGVTYASVIVDPPLRRFMWRACLNPPWEQAMGTAASHRRCPQATFVAGRDAR